jgi:5'-nucleotidase
MIKKTILVDMDSIIADFYFGVIDAYKAETGEVLAPEYIGGWNVDFPNGKNIFAYFSQPGFFKGLKPIPGAHEALKDLHDQGHEVVLVSAATLTSAPGEKYEWLSEHYPWLHRNRVIFAKEKFRVHGDVLIDDHGENMAAWKIYWNQRNHRTLGVGIEYPYNSNDETVREVFDYLAPSYKNFRNAWSQIAARVNNFVNTF